MSSNGNHQPIIPNTTSSSKHSKNFSIPFYWSKQADLESLREYFTTLRKGQVILKTISLDRLEKEEAIIVKEIYSRRAKLVDYIHYISDSYSFKNETAFKAVQIFDHYLHKILLKYLQHEEDEAKLIELFAEFVNSMTIYSILCLNIACKLEEINCNYLSFFNENLLKKKFEISIEDLTKKETEVLKFLNFRVHMPTSFQFVTIFFQILIFEIFSVESRQHFEKLAEKNYEKAFLTYDSNQLVIKLLNKSSVINKLYSSFSESIFNSPLTSSLICFKATLITLSHSMRLDLTLLHDKFNKIVLNYVDNADYLAKVDLEASKVFMKVVKSQKKDEGMGF